jgi:tetratricopeptide (TPR) repeat protein
MANHTKHLLQRGTAAFEAGDYAEAEALLLRVVEQHVDYANVYNMLGVIARLRGAREAARDYFRRALDVNPGYREARLNLAIVLADPGAAPEALEEAGRLQADAPEEAGPLGLEARGKLANAHADLGRTYHALRMHVDAVGEYDKALGLCPDFPDIHHCRGASCRALGDHAGAEASFARAVALHPRYVEAYVSLGRLYRELGAHDKAIAAWNRALEIDPDHRLARASLAEATASRAAGG